MVYVIGNRSTEELVYKTGQYITSPPSVSTILNHVSEDFDVPVSGLCSYGVKGPIEDRLQSNDDFDLTWSEVYNPQTSGSINTIVGLDFTPEDNKRIVIFFAVDPENEENLKQEIIGDGVDFSRVYVKAFLPDLSAIDASFNEELKIPFKDPDGRIAFSKVTLTNGVGYKDFKTTKYGIWYILSKYNFEGKNAKVYDQKVYDMSVLMDI